MDAPVTQFDQNWQAFHVREANAALAEKTSQTKSKIMSGRSYEDHPRKEGKINVLDFFFNPVEPAVRAS